MISEPAVQDLDALATLFDAYRRFYERAPDLAAADAYVRDLVHANRTRFFVAKSGATLDGFVHLLPSFDTLAMRPLWILEDLYVDPATRGSGVGTALMRHAETFARGAGASKLTLSTAHDNHTAQRLYEREGWQRDATFHHYLKTL